MGSVSTSDEAEHEVTKFQDFRDHNPDIEFIWNEWIDYASLRRHKITPINTFTDQLQAGKRTAVVGELDTFLPTDTFVGGVMPVSEWLLKPDLDTIVPNKATSSPSASVLTFWTERSGGTGDLVSVGGCPRRALQRCSANLLANHGINILMGIEIEVCFVKPLYDDVEGNITSFRRPPTLHNGYIISYQDYEMLPMIEEVVSILRSVGIHISSFHAEAATGQWEFALPPKPPLQAIDMYYQARLMIDNVARKHGFKATYYPRPYDYTAGNATHMHFSINRSSNDNHSGVNGTTKSNKSDQNNFIAGVLAHLSSILAFSLSIDESYERVKPSIYGGGEYIAWGTQNREVPLRKCAGHEQHWEFRSVDGMGNMYLAAAAVLAAGICGLQHNTKLELKDLRVDPSKISEEERKKYGITKRLPGSLKESLAALEKDEVLAEALGEEVVKKYVALKRDQAEHLAKMGTEERRLWLMLRY